MQVPLATNNYIVQCIAVYNSLNFNFLKVQNDILHKSLPAHLLCNAHEAMRKYTELYGVKLCVDDFLLTAGDVYQQVSRQRNVGDTVRLY